MTTTADDDTVERAFEAVLAGRPVPPPAGGLAAFADGVRAVAERPGRPSAALAELLATGLLADQPSPSTRTEPTAGPTAPAAACRARRRRTRMFVPALLAKIASLGAVAKAATVTGVVVVGVTTAGFTGALPTPVQHTFATVVDSVTPLTVSDPSTAGIQPAGTTGPAEPAEIPTATPTPEPTPDPAPDPTPEPTPEPTAGAAPGGATGAQTSAHPSNFGGTVSSMAHASDGKPGVDGAVVSSLAHERNAARHSGAATGAAATPTLTATPAQDGGQQKGSGAKGSSGRGRGNR